jgi:hypothetical protein
MKSLKIVIGLILLVAVSIGFQGCVTGFRAANSGVTTKANFLIGHLAPRTTFSTADVICFYVSVTWADVNQEPGWEEVAWNWYKDGQLVGHRENDRAYFKGAPNTRHVMQPASALGTGHFKVECLINGDQIAAAEFDIK